MSGSTALQAEFLQNLGLNLIDLSRRQEQDPSDDLADYVLYRLQQVFSHLSRIVGSVPRNVFQGYLIEQFGDRPYFTHLDPHQQKCSDERAHHGKTRITWYCVTSRRLDDFSQKI